MVEEPSKSLKIHLFGQMEVSLRGEPKKRLRPRSKQILGFLALYHSSDGIVRKTLATWFWPDCGERYADNYLRRCLYEIRGALGEEYIPSHGNARLDLSDTYLDIKEFDEACAREDIVSLQKAVELYRGSLLEPWIESLLPKQAWVEFQKHREKRQEDYLKALRRLADDALEHENYQKAIWYLDKVMPESNHDEDIYLQKITAFLGLNQPNKALLVAQEFKENKRVSTGRIEHIEEKIARGDYSQHGINGVKNKNADTPTRKQHQEGHSHMTTTETRVPSSDDCSLGLVNVVPEPTQEAVDNASDVLLLPDKVDTVALRKIVASRFAEIPLFGEGGASFATYQEVTLVCESTRDAYSTPSRIAQQRDDATQSTLNIRSDVIGIPVYKGTSQTIEATIRQLNQGGSPWYLPILGEPGAGKTTLLHWIVRQASVEEVDYLKQGETLLIPTYISLPTLQDNLPEYLAQCHKGQIQSDVWERLLESGDCLLLLDGLDLVSDTARVRALIRAYPRCPVVVTCRTIMRERMVSALDDKPCYVLEPLQEPNQDTYIMKYPGLSPENRVALQRFILSHPENQRLVSSPLVLSLLCFVAKRKGILERDTFTRTSVYSNALQMLFRESPREADRIALRRVNPVHGDMLCEALADATVYATREMLSELCNAGHMSVQHRQSIVQKANKGTLPLEVLRRGVQSWLAGQSRDLQGLSVLNALLADVCANANVLAGDPTQIFSEEIAFTHQTFQEYLIAKGLADKADKEGWVAIQPYIDALGWLPEFEEVFLFVVGLLTKSEKFSTLTKMLRFLSDPKRDDVFHNRLALTVRCIPELINNSSDNGENLPQELASLLGDILEQVAHLMRDLIKNARTAFPFSLSYDFPSWLEHHPLGRAYFAIGSVYRECGDGDSVFIRLGKQSVDPFMLNEHLFSETRATHRFISNPKQPTKEPSPCNAENISRIWELTLMGRALALPPVRKTLQEMIDTFHWSCLAMPLATSLRHSYEQSAEDWFDWFKSKGFYMPFVAPMLTQASSSLRNRMIDHFLSFLELTPSDATLIVGEGHPRTQYVQEFIGYALRFLLQGEYSHEIYVRALHILEKVPHASAGGCLLNLEARQGFQEAATHWLREQRNAPSLRRYVIGLGIRVGEPLTDEALAHITQGVHTVMLKYPGFVNSLTEVQRYAILRVMLDKASRKADVWGLDIEAVGTITRSGGTKLGQWFRAELFRCMDRYDENTRDDFWRALIELGGETIGLEELQEHIRCIAIKKNPFRSATLIRMAGVQVLNEPSMRAELEKVVRGCFQDEVYQDLQMYKIFPLNHAIDSLDDQDWAVTPKDKVIAGAIDMALTPPARVLRNKIINQPVRSLKLPGKKNVQYAAVCALAHGGVDCFTEDIRKFISGNYKGAVRLREYENTQPPFLEWSLVGVRVLLNLAHKADVKLTFELAAKAFNGYRIK